MKETKVDKSEMEKLEQQLEQVKLDIIKQKTENEAKVYKKQMENNLKMRFEEEL